MAGLQFNPDFQIVSGAELSGTGGSNLEAHASYYNTLGTTVLATYTVYLYASVSNLVTNPDNSIDFDFNGISGVRFSQVSTGQGDWPSSQEFVDLATGAQIWTGSVGLGENYDTGVINFNIPSATTHYHVPAGSSVSFASELFVGWNNSPQDATIIDDINMGFSGTANTNPAEYVPMAIRKSGDFKSFNDSGFRLYIRKNGNFVDISENSWGTVQQPNEGTFQIRKGGVFIQQPPIGN